MRSAVSGQRSAFSSQLSALSSQLAAKARAFISQEGADKTMLLLGSRWLKAEG